MNPYHTMFNAIVQGKYDIEHLLPNARRDGAHSFLPLFIFIGIWDTTLARERQPFSAYFDTAEQFCSSACR